MAIDVAACKAVSEIDQAGTAADCAGKPGSDKNDFTPPQTFGSAAA